MRKTLLIAALLAALSSCGTAHGPIVGRQLDKWTKGYLEIHSINTGRGESFFYILPDGTTLLIDASGANPLDEELEQHDYGLTPPRPSADISPGQVIGDYIRHFLPSVSGGAIDYAMISHYHGDHMGVVVEGMPKHAEGGFALAGITEVGSMVPIRCCIDRGDVMDPPSKNSLAPGMKRRYGNYISFLDWSSRENSTVRMKAIPGALDQIALRHSPMADFHIRTIAAGGRVWDGTETIGSDGVSMVPGSISLLPSKDSLLVLGDGPDAVSENVMSIALHLRYGEFDWFTGGDCQYRGRSSHQYNDIELPISKVMGPVEGMKADHHATNATNCSELLSVLQPDFVIAGTWKNVHPNPATVKRFQKANPSINFITTNLTDAGREILLKDGVDPSTFLATQGHAVVRVAPGGRSYMIYILDDSDERYIVKNIFGPFAAQSNS